MNSYAGSGIDGLDEVLGGGFPRGQTYLINGQSGAGKTTLCMQFLIDGAADGETVLHIGTSENEQEIQRVAKSHGWSLDGVQLQHHRAAEVGADQTMLHPAELELPQTVESMLAVVDRVKPNRLVIDSLSELRVLARDELWYRRQLMLLKEHFAERDYTVMLVETPADHSSLNSIVTGVIELEQVSPEYGPDRHRLRVVKIRGQDFVSGYHDFKILTGGIRVFPRLIAAEHRRRFGYEQMSTGLSKLDSMLHGGLVRGTSTMLLGPSGTGKSLLATQFAIAAAERGERAAMFVFDERVQTLYQRCANLNVPLEEHVERGNIIIQQIDPAELTPGEFSDEVKNLVQQREIRMLVIDSLNGYSYAMPNERTLGIHLHELSSFLNQQALTTVFTMTQHGLMDLRVEQPFDVSYIVDTVLLLRHFEHRGEIHKAVSVYKNRSIGHDTSIRELHIGSDGLELGEPLQEFQGILAGAPTYIGESSHDGGGTLHHSAE